MSEIQERINGVVRSTGIDLSRKTDHIIKTALKREAPLAFWLLSHFPHRWLARLLRLEIRQYQSSEFMNYTFEVLIFGRVIGRVKVAVNLVVTA